jgi:hypothetical protein
MANRVLLKKSSVAGRVPQQGDLEYGELALNYSDGKLYYKSAGNVISSFNADLSSYVTLSGTQTISNKTLVNADFQGTTEFLGVSGSTEYIAYFKGGGEGSKLGVAVSGLASDGVALESFVYDSSAHAKLSINASRLQFNVPLHSGALVIQENGIVNAADGLTVNNVAVATTTGTQTLSNKTLVHPLISGASGDTGASISLVKPETNSDIYDNIVIDTYQDRIRIYESGGTNRGFYLDITEADGSIGTNLLAASTGGGSYTLPTATTSVLGGVKLDGTTITINGSGVISGFSGVYSDLSGKPSLSTVATSGDYDDLSNKPTLFSGSYNDLTDVPTLPSASFQIIAVAGQSSVIADNYQDTLTLVAGDGVTITTNNSTDTITISASGGAGGSYTLPIASTSSLGGIKIGSGLSVDATGVVDVIGASGSTASGVVPYDMGYITEIVYSVQDHGSIV